MAYDHGLMDVGEVMAIGYLLPELRKQHKIHDRVSDKIGWVDGKTYKVIWAADGDRSEMELRFLNGALVQIYRVFWSNGERVLFKTA